MPAITPGVVRPLTTAQVCATRWGHDARHVTRAMRRQVEVAYGVRASGRGPCCEIDHLIPRELGGADDVKNLWPQPWADARKKDREENRLHVAVCGGRLTLVEAQERMRAWRSQ